MKKQSVMNTPLLDPAAALIPTVYSSASASHPRVVALERTGLPDTLPGESFDRLTRLVQRLLHAPVALVSLVDRDRQFFKSAAGLPEPWASRRETPCRTRSASTW